MLTRYRKLYNSLTKSKAYEEKGSRDNSKINKKIFTPHNLKALLIGADGAIAVHYTTNSADNRLVEPIRYMPSYLTMQQQVIPELYQKELQEKGLVYTLKDGLRFNYVEEIIFFTAGFDQTELSKELGALQSFAVDGDVKVSMKRLTAIAVVNGAISNDLLKLDIRYPVLKQLQAMQIPFDVLQKFNPERTELGLLVNRGLNGEEYAMDAKFDPSDEKSAGKLECRLSRYFYIEEQQARKALKEKEAQKAKERAEQEEAAKSVAKGYIAELKAKGFREINDSEPFLGKDKMFSKLLRWLQQFCTEKPDKVTGYKYKTCQAYESVLKANNEMNVKDANIWSFETFSKHPDLEFRAFVRQFDHAYEVIIKLPMYLNSFSFGAGTVEGISMLFSNTNPEKGKVFQSSVMESPSIKNIGSTYNIECVYDMVRVVLVKDLAEFATSSWLLMDYLKACNGEQTAFSRYKNLPLGTGIVVGVKPNSLKAELFDCTGKNQTSGIICGKAGSGKSALMDSMVVQFLALQGDMGNGAVVLMDAKQEWPPLWKKVFQAKGIPFYGFDGSLLSNQASIKKRVVSKTGKISIVNFGEGITQEVGGMFFMSALYEVIQTVLKKAGVKDVREFNKKGCVVEDIKRLPRIAIFIDEMNTFASNSPKGSAGKAIMPYITGGANLTRTAGYMWFLCGQDVPKSIISAEKRSSFKYSIMGTMDKERYDYFGVTENPNVVAYEERYSTSENVHPIMKQGTFYAGEQGKTELVRSLFLPDDEKADALNLLNSNFEGMFELDALVKYGLRHNLFDNFTKGINGKNNIVFAVLRDLGVISEAEFNAATERVFAESGGIEESVDSTDYWEDGEENQESQDIVLDNDAIPDFDPGMEAGGATIPTPQPAQQSQPSNPSPLPPRPDFPKRPVVGANSQKVEQVGRTASENSMLMQHPDWNSALKSRQQVKDTVKKQMPTYEKPLNIRDNPFRKYNCSTKTGSMLSVREMTQYIMEDIEQNVAPFNQITTFGLSDGVLIFNGIVYMPTFNESFLNSLPLSLQTKAISGQIAEFFNLHSVYKFKNLEVFYINDVGTAQGRARKEMGIGFRKRWSCLFKKFKYLQTISVAGINYERENPDTNAEDSILDRFKKNPQSTYSDRNHNSLLDKVWDSRPVRILTNAVGWTVGVQAAWVIASLMGPWGLLFGGLALAGAYQDRKQNGPRYALPPVQPSPQESRQQPSQQRRQGQGQRQGQRRKRN